MHKQLFMLQLKMGLLSLPEAERNEILAEYDAHFEFSKQQGRTEEEIARELGDPEELAAELLLGGRGDKAQSIEGETGDLFDKPPNQGQQVPPIWEDPTYLHQQEQPLHFHHYEQHDAHLRDMMNRNVYPPIAPYEERRSRSFPGLIGTLFISLFIVPLLIGGWGVCIGLGAAAVALLLSPILYVVKLVLGSPIYGSELSVVAIAFGLGILLIQAVLFLGGKYTKWNASYFRWLVYEGKGGMR
ncbi:DUF1700 domain-containing protein [Paenibacillus alvei]|uniref:DUF1700 domain-containing protein n=1 Tax=Paenibacillus alvei TaxID=44250 RepID=UPI003D27FD2F